MMTEPSKPLWWLIFALQKIQFPWRFNVLLCISITALVALAIRALGREIAAGRMLKTIMLALIAVWFPAITVDAWLRFPQTAPDPVARASKERQIEESRDAPEYRPRWNQSLAQLDWDASMDIDNWDTLLEHEFESLVQRVNNSGTGARIIKGTGRVTVTARRPREIDFHVESPSGVTLEASQFYYPYWKAGVLGESNIPIEPSTPDGLLTLRLPAGSHDVHLRLDRSRAEVAGGIVSLGSVMALFAFVAYRSLSSRSILR
jgi:hypothetical protein